MCRNVNGGQDLKEYVKGMVIPAAPPPAKHCFQLPLPIIQASESGDPQVRKKLRLLFKLRFFFNWNCNFSKLWSISILTPKLSIYYCLHQIAPRSSIFKSRSKFHNVNFLLQNFFSKIIRTLHKFSFCDTKKIVNITQYIKFYPIKLTFWKKITTYFSKKYATFFPTYS